MKLSTKNNLFCGIGVISALAATATAIIGTKKWEKSEKQKKDLRYFIPTSFFTVVTVSMFMANNHLTANIIKSLPIVLPTPTEDKNTNEMEVIPIETDILFYDVATDEYFNSDMSYVRMSDGLEVYVISSGARETNCLLNEY